LQLIQKYRTHFYAILT